MILLGASRNFREKISTYPVYWFVCSLKGSSEISLTLACSLLSLLKWLTDVIYKSLQRLSEEKQPIEYVNLVDRSADVFSLLIETQTSRALLYIARLEDPGRTPMYRRGRWKD